MPTDEPDSELSADWYDDLAADVRSKMRPDDEGCVWLLYTDEDHVVVVGFAIEPDGHEPGPLELDGLAHTIDDIDPPGVVLAVSRADGEPLAEDWRLWEGLRGRIAALTRCELLDLVIVGERSWWAVHGGRSHRAA
jgi:hypothetical protein